MEDSIIETGAVDELEAKQPGIFGANGSYSRTYSLTNLSFATGLLVGPLLSGALTESIGYYYMNTVLGMFVAPVWHPQWQDSALTH